MNLPGNFNFLEFPGKSTGKQRFCGLYSGTSGVPDELCPFLLSMLQIL
jgi:hypothetical protein